MQSMIAKFDFGRTGHASSRTLFGAAALGQVTQEEADRTLDSLLEYGVNHIDTAASYGESELRIGAWLGQHRQKFFLATKTGERTYQKAREEIHRSLERLRVDSVDLIQLHNLAQPDEQATALGDDGALHALIEAKQQGLTRFIGVTGHGLGIAAMHRRSLEKYDFDSVLLPYNYVIMQNPQYAADFEALLAICQERNVAVQTIKSLCRRPWGDRPRTRATWYEPFEEQEDIDAAVSWVLQRPGVFLNTIGDIHILPKVFDAATRWSEQNYTVTDARMEAIVDAREAAPLFV
jgi:aryl-alcohol dehydrogenase-like predicted oxidoreductase